MDAETKSKLNGIGNLYRMERFKAVADIDFRFAVIVCFDWICNKFLSFFALLVVLLQRMVLAYSCEWIILLFCCSQICSFLQFCHTHTQIPSSSFTIQSHRNQNDFYESTDDKIRRQTRIDGCICSEEFILLFDSLALFSLHCGCFTVLSYNSYWFQIDSKGFSSVFYENCTKKLQKNVSQNSILDLTKKILNIKRKQTVWPRACEANGVCYLQRRRKIICESKTEPRIEMDSETVALSWSAAPAITKHRTFKME